MTIPPYHPSSNGAAERLVQTTKKTLIKQVLQDQKTGEVRMLQERLDSFLMAYRNTPSTATGKSPAEIFLKRSPWTKLSLLRPSFAHDMERKQERQVRRDTKPPHKLFQEGDSVFVKTLWGGEVSWERGTILQTVSPVAFLVKVATTYGSCTVTI
ncbi:uncharacterized protein K02A2.6-like [Ornithodoros turicata]|uniref:uncharacterized protein K02A2.6-like n=1 Tax=Ornithodoros turicata TaxID=34597 RepID=UPI0031393081